MTQFHHKISLITMFILKHVVLHDLLALSNYCLNTNQPLRIRDCTTGHKRKRREKRKGKRRRKRLSKVRD